MDDSEDEDGVNEFKQNLIQINGLSTLSAPGLTRSSMLSHDPITFFSGTEYKINLNH